MFEWNLHGINLPAGAKLYIGLILGQMLPNSLASFRKRKASSTWLEYETHVYPASAELLLVIYGGSMGNKEVVNASPACDGQQGFI